MGAGEDSTSEGLWATEEPSLEVTEAERDRLRVVFLRLDLFGQQRRIRRDPSHVATLFLRIAFPEADLDEVSHLYQRVQRWDDR